MRAEPLQRPHLKLYVVPAIQNPHVFLAALQSPPQRVGRDVAYKDHHIVGPIGAELEMVQDPPELAGWA